MLFGVPEDFSNRLCGSLCDAEQNHRRRSGSGATREPRIGRPCDHRNDDERYARQCPDSDDGPVRSGHRCTALSAIAPCSRNPSGVTERGSGSLTRVPPAKAMVRNPLRAESQKGY